MTTITLEVPDELATQIHALRDRLPELLARALAGAPVSGTSPALKAAATHPVYRELMDFLATGPAPQQIIDFKLSAAAQERLAELLEKHREAGLTEAESAELDVYELVHHSVIRLKAHAHLAKS